MTDSPVSARRSNASASRDGASWGGECSRITVVSEEHHAERLGRYTLHAIIGVGGMASVYLGSCSGAADCSRIVAIKRMHSQFAEDPEFVSRFRDEAWLSVRLLHPNIVQTFDIVEWERELLLVMEYVEGVTLQALQSDAALASRRLPFPIALGILVPALHGLHAAHEATDDEGRPLGLVHRDFTPHNILVSRDGHAKILDFGVAKAEGQWHATVTGQISGKYGYLSPEQVRPGAIDRRADVFAAGIVLWELLTGERLFREHGLTDAAVLERVLAKKIPAPSSKNPEVGPGLDAITLKALARDPAARFDSARAFALALEAELQPATHSKVEEFVLAVSGPRLARLAELRAGVRRRQPGGSRHSAAPALEPSDTTVEAFARPDDTHVSAPAARSSKWWWLAAVCGVALLLTGVGWGLAPAPAGPASGQSAVVRSLEAASPAQAAAPSPALVAVTPSEERGAEQAPEASASSRAVVPVSSAAPPTVRVSSTAGSAGPRGVVARRRPARSTEPARAVRDRCDPPTYVDAEGIRHFKDGCL